MLFGAATAAALAMQGRRVGEQVTRDQAFGEVSLTMRRSARSGERVTEEAHERWTSTPFTARSGPGSRGTAEFGEFLGYLTIFEAASR